MKKAFTLFELLVSISIIGILVAVASTSYSGAQKKARDSRRMEDLNNIQKAFEQYYGSTGYVYPTSNPPTALSPNYIQTLPRDPKLGIGYTYYNLSTTAYCVCAHLDSGNGNSNAGDCSAFVSTGGSYYCVKNQQ